MLAWVKKKGVCGGERSGHTGRRQASGRVCKAEEELELES